MKPFEYIPVHSVKEACALLSRYGSDACILAGGTDLLIEWRRPNANARKVVIDISPVHELQGVTSSGGMITVQPLTTHTRLMQSEVLRSAAPLLASAASMIGSPQIRNRGTIGGNIMNAATCADTVPPLIALGASITLQSKNGSRRINLVDLFIKPYHTAAHADEVLTGIQFPALSRRTRSAFIKLGRRNALAISRLSIAAILEKDDAGKIVNASIVPGAAFPVWQRVSEAEQMLLGEKGSPALFAAAGKKVSELMIAHTGRRWSTEYKEPVIAVLVRRALEACC